MPAPSRPPRASRESGRREPGSPTHGRAGRAWRDGGRTCARGRGDRRGGRRRPARPGGRGAARRARRDRRRARCRPRTRRRRAAPRSRRGRRGTARRRRRPRARGRSRSSTSPTPPRARAAPRGTGHARAGGRARARPRPSPARRSGCRRGRRRSSVPNRSASPAPASRSTRARSSSGIAFQKLCSKNHSPCRISSTTRGRLERISSVCQSSVISSASAVLEPPPLGERRALVVEAGQERGDPPVRLEDGAARCLGRVGGEDELDPEPRSCRLDLGLVDPAPVELRERIGERFARDPPLGLVLAAPTDPVVLLGDVDELEEQRERPQHGALALGPERRDRVAERAARAAGARIARQGPDPLFLVEETPGPPARRAPARADRRAGARWHGERYRPTRDEPRRSGRAPAVMRWAPLTIRQSLRDSRSESVRTRASAIARAITVVMDINTIASVLVEVFDTEAVVGLAMLAAVIIAIVHGLHQGASPGRARIAWAAPDEGHRLRRRRDRLLPPRGPVRPHLRGDRRADGPSRSTNERSRTPSALSSRSWCSGYLIFALIYPERLG